MSGASARNPAEEPGLTNSKTLDEYRALFKALEAEERDAAALPQCSRSAMDAADAAGRVREALEDRLFEDYNRIGFASESEDSPVRRRSGPLSSEEKVQVKEALSGGMTQAATAARFGVAQSVVCSIKNRPEHVAQTYRSKISPEDKQAIRVSRGLLRLVAEQYGVSMSLVSRIRSGL